MLSPLTLSGSLRIFEMSKDPTSSLEEGKTASDSLGQTKTYGCSKHCCSEDLPTLDKHLTLQLSERVYSRLVCVCVCLDLLWLSKVSLFSIILKANYCLPLFHAKPTKSSRAHLQLPVILNGKCFQMLAEASPNEAIRRNLMNWHANECLWQ